MIGWLAVLAISVAVSAVSYLLTPKPKLGKPAAATDLDDPTAEGGREIPVIFGDITVKAGNILWFGDKSTRQYKVKA